ncbi:MAG: alpha-galactosidase, partial [Trebonia sp.]
MGAGELILPDEVVVDEGESYTTPWLYGSYGTGLDAVAARFHAFLRGRPQHPRLPRPIGLNTWEAVYFNHDLDHLLRLAERAAELGVERFVLDDGWFLGRRNDRSALGDWFVDPDLWPDGLGPLVELVKQLGMQFGLWFEPEMVSLDSRLAREHPEWLFDAGHGVGVSGRHQHVLDLGHAGAYDYILDRVSALVDEYGIDYLKWDHNRPLTDAGHQPSGAAGVRAQVLATYRMMDELKARHPGLEIESCASGGGRIDLGMLERADRVWVSDCNDPHERLEIQR